jgi:hypothetical protein
MKRLAALRDPRSVAYLGGARMIDLSHAATPSGGAPAIPASADATASADDGSAAARSS